MIQYNAFEQEVLSILQSQAAEIAELKALLTPAEVDPFAKVRIKDVADKHGRNTAALTRKADAKGLLIKIPGMGNANYIEQRNIQLLLKAS